MLLTCLQHMQEMYLSVRGSLQGSRDRHEDCVCGGHGSVQHLYAFVTCCVGTEGVTPRIS